MTVKIELEPYIIGQEIRRDDFAEHYQGRRRTDNHLVTLKFILPHLTQNSQFVDQYWDNSQRNLALDHPNIIHTYDVQFVNKTLYTVQEWVEARPLSEVMESDGAFSPKRLLKIAHQIAAALDYAFEQGIIHGDLSAQNVLIAANDHVFVTDFGQTQTLAHTPMVKSGYPLGTPETLAPEIIQGQPPSPQADLYALGILCYAMLANEYPFQGTLAHLLHAHVYEAARPLHLTYPHLTPPVSQAIERLLTKQPSYRYQAANEFIKTLTTALNTAPKPNLSTVTSSDKVAPPSITSITPSLQPTRQTPLKKSASLNPLWFVAIIFMVLGGLLGASSLGLISLWQISQAAPVTPEFHFVTPPAPPTPTATLIRLEPMNMPAKLDFPTPGRPVLTAYSPFSNLQLTQEVTPENRPASVGTAFDKGHEPVYLFFDYANIKPGTTWSHRWTWADTELAAYQATWSTNFPATGTAWIFYAPEGEGYQPGPYKVNLWVEGRMVATATFVILP